VSVPCPCFAQHPYRRKSITLEGGSEDCRSTYARACSSAFSSSRSSVMLYLVKVESVSCPMIVFATACGTPARIMLRAAVRRRSWKIFPLYSDLVCPSFATKRSTNPRPAVMQARRHCLPKTVLLIARPLRWKT